MSNNFKKVFTVICLCLAFVLSACSAQDRTAMQIGENSANGSDASESPVDAEIATAFRSGASAITVPLFLRTLDTTKAEIMSQYASIEEYYGITIESVYGTPIADTEAFWSITYSEHEDGTAYTLGEYVFDRTVNACKQMLAIEGLASAVNYELPEEFEQKREEEYNSMVEKYGSADRWSVELAKDNLTINDWDRVLRYYHTGNYLSEFMFEQKLLDEPSLEQAKKSLDDSAINFKFLNYYLNPDEEDTDETEASETTSEAQSTDASEAESVSEEVSQAEVATDDAAGEEEGTEISEESAEAENSEEEIDPKVLNAEIIAHAKKVYDDLVSGSVSFDDALALSDDGELIKAYYPDGMMMKGEEFKQFFGIEAASLKVGDFHYYEDLKNNIVYIVQRIDFTETAVSDEKENLKNELFSDYIVELSKDITVNDDVISDYKNIWEVNG